MSTTEAAWVGGEVAGARLLPLMTKTSVNRVV
jgi:hypothetical protein